MALVDQETIFLTKANPVIFGPTPDTLDIPNVICQNLTVTNSMTVDGIKLATDAIAVPAMTLSYMQAVSAAPADIPLALLPKGAGGIMVDYPDNAATGGDLRGSRAIDLQFQRAASTQVASGDTAFLAGTISCTASGLVSGVVSSQTSVNGGNTSFTAAASTSSLLTSTNSIQLASTGANMDTTAGGVFIGTTGGFMTGATRAGFINSSGGTLAAAVSSTVIASAGSTIANASNNFIAATTAGTINVNSTFSSIISSSTARVAGTSNRAGVFCALGSGGIDITGSTDAALIGANTSTLTNCLRTVVVGADKAAMDTNTRTVICGSGSDPITITNAIDSFVGGCFGAAGSNWIATAAVGGYGNFTTAFACGMIGCGNGSMSGAQYSTLVSCLGTSSIANVATSTLISCNDTTISGITGKTSAGLASDASAIDTSERTVLAGTDTCTVSNSQICFIGGCTTSQITNTSTGCAAVGAQGVINNGDTVVILGAQSITSAGCARCIVGATASSATGCTETAIFGRGIAATRSNAFIFADGGSAPFDATNNGIFSVSTTGARAVEFYTNGAATTGVFMNNGDSAWNAISDRKKKENIEEIRAADYLEKLEAIPIYTYNYIGAPKEKRCIGPMAQDWSPAFSPDPEALHINSGEVQGVLLAAVKALAARVRELEARLAAAKI